MTCPITCPITAYGCHKPEEEVLNLPSLITEHFLLDCVQYHWRTHYSHFAFAHGLHIFVKHRARSARVKMNAKNRSHGCSLRVL